MGSKILVGPLLGLESEDLYTVCFSTDQHVQQAQVNLNGHSVDAVQVGTTSGSLFWRAQHREAPHSSAKVVHYRVHLDGEPAANGHEQSEWHFYVPAADEAPRFAYASCNGFSSADLVNKTEHPYALWQRMRESHEKEPFALLLMGGDQLYADEMWGSVSSLKAWGKLPRSKKTARNTRFTKTMQQQVERFYEDLYRSRWSDPDMAYMYASVPNVMMWDDHDIFDGWGSFPKDMHECNVFQGIFQIARHYFELFQIRSRHNTSLLNPAAEHYAFAFQFRGYHILALDNRAERTLQQVMSATQWQDLIHYFNQHANSGHLLLLSAVPVVYRDFSFTESVVDATPWEEELTDDLKDHWRAKEHQCERARLVMRLLENHKRRQGKTVILSGDVHIGCLGVINDRRDGGHRIHQVVSSGIVHPAPSRIAWLGIMAVTNDKKEYLTEDHSVEIAMLQPYHSDKYLRSRNYVQLKEGSDQKLWVTWECESKDKPVYPMA
ncbi:alkaline phosphatase D family protein [Ketobacter sp.]|uniref:alkaline phosphatase D family protein n=1 Tax=Ketobacter sp. TaxID=2083498 RepID=UPI000F0F64E4|nr:alkaline phosphatase D family protein [Ketobacter sp.]RLT93800.1 MAG: alkaline phosphatase family protein [Ketobacter sp.]